MVLMTFHYNYNVQADLYCLVHNYCVHEIRFSYCLSIHLLWLDI